MKPSYWFVCFLVVVFVAPVWGGSIVIGTEDGWNAFPYGGAFGDSRALAPGTRYQQAYDASSFLPLGPITINSISFQHGILNFAPSTYTLYFSTITDGIDALSSTNFDSNRASNNAQFTSVYLSGAAPSNLILSGNPFIYDPSQGNLLLDIVVSPGGQPVNEYEASFAGSFGSAAGIFSRYQNFGTTESSIGWGLVTAFHFTPYVPQCSDCTPPPCTNCGAAVDPGVPEPVTFSLAALGLGLIFVARLRK